MREAEVTDEAIIEAGNSLIARGRKVTKSGLRVALGAGNSDRLLAVWEAYVAKAQQAALETVKLPEDLEAAIQANAQRFVADMRRLYAEINDAAVRVANERAQEVEESCRRKLAAAAEDAAAAEQENERLNAEHQAATAELAQLRVRMEDAYRELQETRAQHSKLKDQLIEAQGDHKMVEVELRGQQNLVAEMAGEREKLRERHSEEIALVKREVAATREQLAHAHGQIAALTQQLDALIRRVGASDASDAS